MSQEIQDEDYLCAECIDKAGCHVSNVFIWYTHTSCWLCKEKGRKTMQVTYIEVKGERR